MAHVSPEQPWKPETLHSGVPTGNNYRGVSRIKAINYITCEQLGLSISLTSFILHHPEQVPLL
jgi:hypothetical protein